MQVTKPENFAAPAEPAAPKVLEISSSHQSGAHYWEPATPIISQCNGIFTDQSIFRYFSREIGQFQSKLACFGEGKTMRPHVASREHRFKNISICENAVRGIWGSCRLLLMGSCINLTFNTLGSKSLQLPNSNKAKFDPI